MEDGGVYIPINQPESDEIELTQTFVDETTMHAHESDPIDAPLQTLEVWGVLKLKDSGKDLNLEYRNNDNRRDSYTIGRSRACDLKISEKRVSSKHCVIYCDYEHARRRVFVEDCSSNGTFVNDSLTRLAHGERYELKSGDEIFLLNPHNISEELKQTTSFIFVNMRDRLVTQRAISLAPAHEAFATGDVKRHIEDFYVIGDPIGSGMCGQVHICVNCATGEHCVSRRIAII